MTDSLRYRLIATDIDETPFGSDCIISPRTRAAIPTAMQPGVIVTLVTGRSFPPSIRLRVSWVNAPVIICGAAISAIRWPAPSADPSCSR